MIMNQKDATVISTLKTYNHYLQYKACLLYVYNVHKRMATYDSFASAISALGQAVIKLAQVNRSELAVSEQTANTLTTEEEWIEYAQGTDYWRSWNQISDILSQYADNYSPERYPNPTGNLHEFTQATTIQFSTRERKIGSLRVEYNNNGVLYIRAPYQDPVTDSREVLCDVVFPWMEIDLFELSRTITRLELTSLAHEFGSCAAVVDYYMTTYTSWYTQTEWSDIRGVNRQTVNDRNREAKRALEQ